MAPGGSLAGNVGPVAGRSPEPPEAGKDTPTGDGNFLPGHPYQLAPMDGYGTRAIQAT